MRRRAAGRVVAGLAVLLSVSVVACAGSAGGCGAAVGRTAPPFATTDVGDRPVRLADYAGRPVLVNFWASWCIPCQAEFPVLRSVTQAHPDVAVLGVVFEDTAANARSFLQDQHATWPGLVDPKSQIASRYCVTQKPGIPVSALV